MNRIEKTFQQIKEKDEKAFVPYIMAGDGGLEVLIDRIQFLEKCGATAVEVGIPFSDPVADGPTIQEAGIRALMTSTCLKEVLHCIGNARNQIEIPIILMSYMNPIIAYGIDQFAKDAQEAGIDGCIFPDLPIEEEELIKTQMDQCGIELIRLVTLTSPLERIEAIAKKGKGYLYAVTITGITGVRREFNKSLGEYLQKVKSISPIPVLAGFGISTVEHVIDVSQYCDGVIVGSKIVELFQEGKLSEIEALIKASKKVKI
jgi:tryptophan synthase alpha chain